MKRDKYDKIVSDLIRESANWTCERCGIVSPDGQAYGKDRAMHCSHFKSRINKSTRWEIDNLSCLCAACHKRLGENPDEHTIFIASKLGAYRLDRLIRKGNQSRKWREDEKAEMYRHYKNELERIKHWRLMGDNNYIEVVNYD